MNSSENPHLRRMRFQSNRTSAGLATLLVTLLLVSLIPAASATQGRAGPDIAPTSAYVSYVSSTDHSNHAALSSQDPSAIGLGRSADLWIIDGMLGLQQEIEVTVENIGDSAAGSFDVDVEILHDEYSDFILHSYRGTVSSLAAGSSTTVTTIWTPDYSGNHTIRVTSLLSNDGNTNNDVGTRSLTIGNLYERAEAAGSWTLGNNWYVSDEASLSSSNSFHVGGSTSSSNYGNNWDTSLTSATMDTSDAHPSPSRGIGVGFFYTGEALTGDGYDIDVWNGNSWQRITTTVTSSVDTNFDDGSSWLINVNQVGNQVVPWWGIPASTMNSQFKFRINFHSNAGGTSLGYWFEDIVMFYDQRARSEEYAISASSGSSGHAQAGEWAETTISLSNSGNLSDSVALSVSNLPSGWNHRFQHMTGSQIQDGARIDLAKGEARTVKLLVQPADGSPMGSTTVNVLAQSMEASVTSSTSASFIVDPGYQPAWVEQDPGFPCAPGNACDFEITLRNDGDGQDTFSLSSSSVLNQDGWTFGLKWDQPTIITIPKDGTEIISITANLPQDALPGMRVNSEFVATSQADPDKVAKMRVNVTASMVSNGGVGVDSDDMPDEGWWISPGESITVPFTIWNNATQQDSYTFSFDSTGVFGWTIGLLSSESVIIGPGSTARVLVSFTAPDSAQANDPGPIVTPHVVSVESGMSGTEGVFSGIRVRQLHDVTLTMNTPAIDIVPGQPNEIPFEVENLGNGAENIIFDLDASSGWTWWVEFNSAIISGPLSLSTTYDGNSVALGTLWIEVPGNEDPGQVFDLTFTASPIDGEDASPGDASVSWQYRTQMTAIPDLSDFTIDEVSLWIGQSESWTISLQNSGNTYDSSLRLRVTSDKNVPGMIVQAVTSRGTGQLNGWVDVPMSPGGVEEIMIVFETFDNFPLGDSILLTVEVEGGQVTNQDVIQTFSTDLRVTVDQKRSVEATWNLDSNQLFSPEEMNTFQINVTTDSTMAVTVNLTSSVPESVFLDCRPRSQDGGVVLFIPASSPGPAQTATIDCDLSLEADERERTVNFVLTDEMGETIWSSGQVHLKTEQIEESDGFAGFGSSVMLIAGIAGGVVFISFLVYKISLIYSRRRTLDEIEDMDEEEISTYGSAPESTVPVVVQQPVAQTHVQPTAAAPGPMPSAAPVTQVVEPTPEPSPADYTDEQLRASGWSDEQIQELRGVPASSVADAFNALGETSVQNELPSSSLPAFNCIVTGNVLTATDAWWQCSGCGGFAAATAIAVYTHCPACNLAR
ncbi:MAG: CARDB domain-containing protein [Candidatus Thermoplasmatota archaeon]|nr:CARDB domain-containing protein [Candidatus Thermoplasmatota archaeon]